MQRMTCSSWIAAVFFLASGALAGDRPSDSPKPLPLTRPEMKLMLENLKKREPRLPLPPPTEEEKAAGRSSVNNGRMRKLYLPAEWTSGTGGSSGSREPDPQMTLDNTFKTRLFWIVSRGNNCHYCLGHQEMKLRAAGMKDDEVAALDCQWKAFPEAEQAAMEFTRKLTLTPHLIDDADIAALRKHYSETQVVEIVLAVSGFNSTNRWTDSLGIPQDQSFSDRSAELNTPTSEAFRSPTTQVVTATDPPRPELEDADAVQQKLAECKQRKPRVTLPSEESVRKNLPSDYPAGPLPQWVRAMGMFKSGAGQIAARRKVAESGRISPLLKAELAWISARENRAWYAAGQALERLTKMGAAADLTTKLDGTTKADGEGKAFSEAERAAFSFARKLTARPKAICDADIAGLRKHYADAEVAEIVFVVCSANQFDRFTESLGLALE